MKRLLLAVVLLSAAVPSPLLGQDDESTRRTLANLKGVRVLAAVLPDSDQARRDGLPPDQLQTDVELKLRQAGIIVMRQDDAIAPALVVNVMAFKTSTQRYVVNVTVDLYQWVSPVRSPSVTVWASTWSTPISLGTSPPGGTLGKVRDTVKDLTDQFINAYLSVNPRR